MNSEGMNLTENQRYRHEHHRPIVKRAGKVEVADVERLAWQRHA